MAGSLRIACARPSDVPIILSFIRKLAEYEKLLPSVTATEEILRQSLFGERPAAEVLLAYWDDEPSGIAIFFHNFSTFLGQPGIYLEDLFVDVEHRGKGIGKALLVELARLAKQRRCGRLDWSVLDWNTPSIEFYKRLGAVPLHDWTTFRVTGDALDKLAATGA